jgi:glycerol kinase
VAIAAVGLTNQRETTVVWDAATGAPLHRAIVWNDGRTAGICDAVAAEAGGDRDRFRAVTGLPVSPYFSAYKLKWLLSHCPAVAAAARAGTLRAGTVDAWLIWNLTGGTDGGAFVTDVTNAARAGLLSLAEGRWHGPTAAALGLDTAWLPRVASCAEVYGTITPAHGGPAAGAPLAGCLGDQQAATLGHGCGPGDAKATFGTGLFLLAVTGGGGDGQNGETHHGPVPSKHGLLTTVAYQLGRDAPPVYALEGAVAVAGAAVTWLRDGLGLVATPAEVGDLAASVASTGGVYAVPALAGGLLAPRWRPDARGALLGLTSATSRAHVARAVLEAVGWSAREVVDAARADVAGSSTSTAASFLPALRVDGGACKSDVLMGLTAAALGVPVVRPAHQETTSKGAALAAGVGAGLWSAADALAAAREEGDGESGWTTFQPAAGEAARARTERRYARWRAAVERALGCDELDDSESGEEGEKKRRDRTL